MRTPTLASLVRTSTLKTCFLGGLLALAGCGGTVHVVCTSDTSTLNECIDYAGPSSAEKSADEQCTGMHGTVSAADCPTTGLLGTCDASAGDRSITIYIYAGGEVSTEADATTVCTQAGGEYTPASQS
jgi:hypothetical protein